MSALPDGRKRRSPVEVISEWWRVWIGNGTRFSELPCCAEPGVERIAKDVGVSAAEPEPLASLVPAQPTFAAPNGGA